MARLISDSYRKLNIDLHARDANFGNVAIKNAHVVYNLANQIGAKSILDYGCGKGTLKAWLDAQPVKFDVFEYDPAVPGRDAAPTPADLVACMDVMEHIEPECLDDVIEHIRSLTGQVALFMISCKLTSQILADGRNAHLIVQRPEWWANRVGQHMKVINWQSNNPETVAIFAGR